MKIIIRKLEAKDEVRWRELGDGYCRFYEREPSAAITQHLWDRTMDSRHTWASWHVQNGTSLQELQQLGGWASYEMVLRYAHLSSDHLKKAADRVFVTNLLQLD